MSQRLQLIRYISSANIESNIDGLIDLPTAPLTSITDLTGSHPQPSNDSLAGVTHDLHLKTTYYAAQVPVWLDVTSSPAEWATTFLTPEAKEVLDVLGGLVVVFSLPSTTGPSRDETRNLLSHVGRVVREGLGGWQWDGVSIGIGVGETSDVDEWEDCCADGGLEFIQVKAAVSDKRNEFGGRFVSTSKVSKY